jgi:hypothetical protein
MNARDDSSRKYAVTQTEETIYAKYWSFRKTTPPANVLKRKRIGLFWNVTGFNQ